MTQATELILTAKITDILNANRFLAKDKLAVLIVNTVKNLDNAISSEIPARVSNMLNTSTVSTSPVINKSSAKAAIAIEAAKAGGVPDGSVSLEGTGLEFGKDYKIKTMTYQITEYKPWNPKNSIKLHNITNGKGYKAPLATIQAMLGLPITKPQ